MMDHLVTLDGGLPYKPIVLGFMWTIYVWEQYLAYRQYRLLRDPTLGVPKSLKAEVTDEDHQKAKAYGVDKALFGFVTSAFTQIQNTLLIVLDALPSLWAISGDLLVKAGLLGERDILRSVLFVLIMVLGMTVLQIPFSLYSTFVIEERHGFNKQTIALFLSDLLKELLLTVVLLSPLIAGLLSVIQWGGDQFFYYVWIFMLVFQIVMVIIYPTLIQPLFNTFKPLEEGALRQKIEKLAKSVNFPLAKIFVIDGSKRSSHSNAYFFGFFKQKRIVLYDTLLEHSNHEEICAVLAHELGHWKKSHIYKMLGVSQFQIFVMFYLFSHFIKSKPLYEAFGFSDTPIIVGLILFSFLYQPADSLMSFVGNVLSRKHEFEADAFAKKLGHTATLVSALIKLNTKNRGNLNPDKLYSAWHYSHPPLVERLAAIAPLKKTD
ncbi:peptidase family M48-domain-containing protein [Zopfochytrium polystomum]|nr:peptidase family M48-domain-containing protein [Zopfochytrium polystomum]